ncbi:MAG: nicotinate-nucleotide adenylyltransferase [Lachnospiraceae bacterium]|nr:nicotinate-nucleotide adenylyltransferase [Lachnospiraceae bacterium]
MTPRIIPDGTKGWQIGFMGGTFDPIHDGHLSLARDAKKELSLDAVLFIPAGCPYLKRSRLVADPADRYEMTALAIQDEPDFYISDIEVRREGNTYTADTLEELHGIYPGNHWFFLTGADSYSIMDKWVRPDRIFELSTVVCTARDDIDRDELEILRERYTREYGGESIILNMPQIDLSSTAIREMTAKGESTRGLLPETVRRYIDERNLYRP